MNGGAGKPARLRDGAQMTDTTTELDTTGLSCPMPILKGRRAYQGVPPGSTLRVRATDPGAVKDFEAFCAASGAVLEAWSEEGGVFTIVIRKPA